jgi:hypothetical protein
MATLPTDDKSAMGSLLETLGEVIDSGSEKMSEAELRESEKKFNAAVDRAVASRKQPSETS